MGLFHVLFCERPERALWEALAEADCASKALYAWAPDAWEGRNPPQPIRAAIFAGLKAAGGGPGSIVGFTADRAQVDGGSVWRATKQNIVERWLSPLPGVVWTAEPETFDGCFTYRWTLGAQAAFALGRDQPVPEIPAGLMARWLAKEADALPPIPRGVALVLRTGADGGMFAVYGRSERAYQRFVDGFREALDWRSTTFRRLLEPQVGPTLVRLSVPRAGEPAPGDRPWYEGAAGAS